MSRMDDWSEPMRKVIREYNDPPPPPADEMWEVISRRLARGDGESGVPDPSRSPGAEGSLRLPLDRKRRAGAWLRPSLAAAAILILGIALGRWSESAPEMGAPEPLAAGGSNAGAGGPQGTAPAFQAVAASYLQDTESFLTLLRADAREGRLDEGLDRWAKGLLLQTRLLLDSPQADEPGVRSLLEDLELVLVQVIQLPVSDEVRGQEELRWIDEGVRAEQVLTRVQSVIPVGMTMAGT
jgi:hypothetical protein